MRTVSFYMTWEFAIPADNGSSSKVTGGRWFYFINHRVTFRNRKFKNRFYKVAWSSRRRNIMFRTKFLSFQFKTSSLQLDQVINDWELGNIKGDIFLKIISN